MALSASQFSQMVAEHGPALYRLAYRLVGNHAEAEDLVQETFRSVWDARARYDAERGARAWLTTILRRRMVDSYRKRRLPTLASDDFQLEIARLDDDPFDQTYTDEVQLALGRLAPELRETLLLVVVSELTHQEASEVLDVPIGTVLSRVYRAKEKLREYLAAGCANRASEGRRPDAD